MLYYKSYMGLCLSPHPSLIATLRLEDFLIILLVSNKFYIPTGYKHIDVLKEKRAHGGVGRSPHPPASQGVHQSIPPVTWGVSDGPALVLGKHFPRGGQGVDETPVRWDIPRSGLL